MKVVSVERSKIRTSVELAVSPASAPVCENGCSYNEKCVPYGIRAEGKYCALSGQMEAQKKANTVCENSFECGDNVCTAGTCTDVSKLAEENRNLKGMFYKLWCRITHLFNDDAYNKCLADNLGMQPEAKYVIVQDFGQLKAGNVTKEDKSDIITTVRSSMLSKGYIDGEEILYSIGDNSDATAAAVLEYNHNISFEEFDKNVAGYLRKVLGQNGSSGAVTLKLIRVHISIDGRVQVTFQNVFTGTFYDAGFPIEGLGTVSECLKIKS